MAAATRSDLDEGADTAPGNLMQARAAWRAAVAPAISLQTAAAGVTPHAEAHAIEDDVRAIDQGEFVRAPACEGCRHRSTCYGVRRGYADLYGTDELKTVP